MKHVRRRQIYKINCSEKETLIFEYRFRRNRWDFVFDANFSLASKISLLPGKRNRRLAKKSWMEDWKRWPFKKKKLSGEKFIDDKIFREKLFLPPPCVSYINPRWWLDRWPSDGTGRAILPGLLFFPLFFPFRFSQFTVCFFVLYKYLA